MFGFLAATPEHERIAALQTNHRASGLSQTEQQVVDLVLAHVVVTCLLAGEDARDSPRDQNGVEHGSTTIERRRIGMSAARQHFRHRR